MSKKLVVALILLCILAIIPWIWIYQEFGGFTNIPHYDLMMWDFMLDYFLLFALMFVGILAGFSGSEEPIILPGSPPPAAQPKKQEKNGIEHLHQIEETEKAEEITEELAPEELQEQQEEPLDVEPPEEWAEKKYE